jgi:hypothetical protein
MGIIRHKRSTDFICDICHHFRVEEHGETWDEARAASAMVKQEGWRLGKERGQWKAFCPACNEDTGYSIEDLLR